MWWGLTRADAPGVAVTVTPARSTLSPPSLNHETNQDLSLMRRPPPRRGFLAFRRPNNKHAIETECCLELD